MERCDGNGGSGNEGGLRRINEGGGETTVGVPVLYDNVFTQLFNCGTGGGALVPSSSLGNEDSDAGKKSIPTTTTISFKFLYSIVFS